MMCSHLLKTMMENFEGDLSDVVRPTTTASAAEMAAATSWQFSATTTSYQSIPEDFGDPFTYARDPLTQNVNSAPAADFFYHNHNLAADHKRPTNIFSRMLQISPNAKQLPLSPPCEAAPPQRVASMGSGLQISSPRNTGIKRRKSQAKKVVCIPAPAPANSRSTGEIVPSDLWAWRKYGQKPIKGSPYPRGYYRCSSSKGCSARKQVERSRTDPNMLVITYTSEHNHPWPTQRNALAGSTRSQTAKNNNNNNNNNNNAAKNPSSSSSSPNSQAEKPSDDPKQEHKETSSTLKEEMDDQELEAEFDQGFGQTYKPTSNQEQDSFFADLGEIGDDPLNLFQGFSHDNDLDDPFNFYDWAAAASPAGESSRHS